VYRDQLSELKHYLLYHLSLCSVAPVQLTLQPIQLAGQVTEQNQSVSDTSILQNLVIDIPRRRWGVAYCKNRLTDASILPNYRSTLQCRNFCGLETERIFLLTVPVPGLQVPVII
jgi:hypothetical protein